MKSHDVIVIGGGPAGSTAALQLARAGIKTILLEKAKFPRFHIGESILPYNMPIIQQLGLEPQLRALPHVPKHGAEFVMGGDASTSVRFDFNQGLLPGSATFNIERAAFDEMLLNAAVASGVEVRQNSAVEKITRLADDDVAVITSGQEVTARYILDASGQGAVIGRHLGIRKPVLDEELRKIAYFSHFDGVQRRPGIETGHPCIVMAKEGWFWLIGLTEKKTSVGFVTRPDFVKTINVPPNRLLQWAINRCPVVRDRMKKATGPDTNEVVADFSYHCRPYAGPGYFMIGDAACFLDPIFSTGVTLAMTSAMHAATQVKAIIKQNAPVAAARREHISFIERTTSIFFRLIRGSYQHSFRELFINGKGPWQVHKAVISILAGNVFPKAIWPLRWRLRLFEVLVFLNRYVPMVKRQPVFSLVEQPAATIPETAEPTLA